MYQPDKTDWKIIALLNKDGRISSAEIARQIEDITARTVNNRIEALQESGIINIRSIVNPEKTGYPILADVFIEVEPSKIREVANAISDFPEISYLACATGDVDIIVSVRASSIQELYEFVIENLSNIPGVRHTETYLLPLNLKTNASWLPPDILDK